MVMAILDITKFKPGKFIKLKTVEEIISIGEKAYYRYPGTDGKNLISNSEYLKYFAEKEWDIIDIFCYPNSNVPEKVEIYVPNTNISSVFITIPISYISEINDNVTSEVVYISSRKKEEGNQKEKKKDDFFFSGPCPYKVYNGPKFGEYLKELREEQKRKNSPTESEETDGL